MTKALMEQRAFVPSGFFALRTPLLPLREFLAWSAGLRAPAALDDPALLEQALAADRARLRAGLCELVERPEIREALFVASPDLDESLDVWTQEPDSERGGRIERAIVRYFARMAGRPTPFGLFAGNSLGTIGDRTRLVLEGRNTYKRHSRLDMDYLFALADVVGRDPALRKAFDLRPNSSLYRAAGRVHYVEARLDGKNRTYHLVAAEDSAELQTVLNHAANGTDAGTLAAVLVRDEVSPAEAAEYVQELIDSQILCPDLDLLVTGRDPTEVLAHQLRGRPETASLGARLEDARRELSDIDAAGLGTSPERYREVARGLQSLSVPVELSRLFQVDMMKPSPGLQLGGDVLREIVRGVEFLRRLSPPRRPGDLTRFRDAFVDRFESREVSLAEALDEEAGIGFPPAGESDADAGPLLKGIVLPSVVEDTVPWGPREQFLLRRLAEATARGSIEIALEPGKIGALEAKEPAPLPGAFAVMVEVAAASEEALSAGDFRLLWNGSDGPSGARLLGRFCHGDPVLRRFVEEHLRAEEALDPEAVFAEAVHLPEGRLGNILFRPVLREYEIPYFGRSGAPLERQLPISDLRVSVADGRVVLRSQRLGRRVIPRLTSAHNWRWRGLPLYRFLCELQGQDGPSLGWDWGPLGSAPFLPRVVSGRLVLARAQWTVGREELERVTGLRGAERFAAVQAWRVERRLPRLVVLADGDNQLPIDLTNVLCVESFASLVKDRDEARLIEMFPGPDDLCAGGPEGTFVHELIVPFVRTAREAGAAPGVQVRKDDSPPASAASGPAVRSFPPGSEWLYAKLYTGAATADRLLLDVVGPLVREALDSGAADRWFFIRYADPGRHLRLRLHGTVPELLGRVLPALHAAAGPALADGRVVKVQLDTYEREVERYGGPQAIEIVERIFQADSEAVLEVLDMLEEGDAGADERWRLTLKSIDVLLDDFGLEQKGKQDLIERVRPALAAELGAGREAAKRGLGDRFRKESRRLELLFDRSREDESALAPGFAVLRRRSQVLAPWMAQLVERDRAGALAQPLAAIAQSCVHMHVNRILRSAQRAQEFVLYDFLARLYRIQAARAQTKP